MKHFKQSLTLAAGMLIGAAAMLFYLAWPEISVSQADTTFIQAFRDMGCQPYKTDSGALRSGCEAVKHVAVGAAR